jgi:hypothetical protein
MKGGGKMKKLIISLLVVAFLAATMLSTVIAGEQKDSFSIDYLGDSKPDVVLDHKKHIEEFKIKCKDCHHTLKTDEETPKACKECHKPTEDTDVDGKKAVAAKYNEKGTKNIFHDRCKACHKEKEKGPTKCKGCHPK